MLILGVSCIVFGIAVRGLIYAGHDDDELTTAVCGGDAFRVHLVCLDFDEYFGSMAHSALTMLQAVTLDRWAAHVARPMMNMRPEAALFFTCFVSVSTYGLLNIAVGVIVWSTIEEAKQHDTHRDRVAVVQDRERIKKLREYFDGCLQLEGRDLLDLREIREAMMVAPVKKAYDELHLPVTDLNQLWAHLDTYSEGEITPDQFEHGCASLLEPATRIDMASLSAKLNGRASFAENLGRRCDETISEMDHIFSGLQVGFAKMRAHVLSDEINELFAEVGLRRAGKMKIPPPPSEDD